MLYHRAKEKKKSISFPFFMEHKNIRSRIYGAVRRESFERPSAVVYYAESALVMARLPLVRLSASDWQFLFVQREPPTFVAAY